MLRGAVYPYEYMDDWEKFKETILPEKEEFYGNLNIEKNYKCRFQPWKNSL